MKRPNYRLKQIKWMLISLVAVIAPLLCWIIFNRDTYLRGETASNTGIGLVLSVVFILCILRGAFKNFNKNFNTIIWLGSFLGLTYFLDAILKDLFWILLFAIIGYLFYMPCEYLASVNKRRADIASDEKIKEDVRADYGKGRI